MSDPVYTVTQKEAADFLHVSTKSISRYRKRGLPYKLILNSVTGKQEVRFQYADLERWDEGRQLLATYARDGGEQVGDEGKAPRKNRMPDQAASSGFLTELLTAYKEQIELLRDQLEDMRAQLARRDRQIDDLMRLMVGLQLEYKPLPAEPAVAGMPVMPEPGTNPDSLNRMESMELFETIPLPERLPAQRVEVVGQAASAPLPGPGKKVFSREQLSTSILRLRRKAKSFEEIAGGLNRLGVATLSGQPEWTAPEVKTLLPPLVPGAARSLADEGEL